MAQNRLPVTSLLEKLKEKNQENNGDLSEQVISLPEPTLVPKIPSLQEGQYLLMSSMLEARFRFAGSWTNATLSFTWLSLAEMESVWTDNQFKRQLALRKDHWPTSVVNQYALDKLALFGIDIDQKDEIYLVFSDAEEPQVVSYFGAQEKRYDDLQTYVSRYLGLQ